MTQRTRHWLRLLYLFEFAVLACPAMLMTGSVAIFGIAVSAFGLSYGVSPFGVALMLMCLSGLIAMAIFCRLSIAYLLDPAEKFYKHRRKLLLCLAYAAVPSCFIGYIAATFAFRDALHLGALPFLSGLLLFIPITHLWLALREAGRATMKESG